MVRQVKYGGGTSVHELGEFLSENAPCAHLFGDKQGEKWPMRAKKPSHQRTKVDRVVHNVHFRIKIRFFTVLGNVLTQGCTANHRP